MIVPRTGPSTPASQSAKRPNCPQCGGELSRVSRRLIDRLQSLFRPVQRYRCRSFNCQWVGNIPSDTKTASPSDRAPL